MINIEALKQRYSIYDQIVGNAPATGHEKMRVFPIEAGLGKTTTTVAALREINEQGKDCKSLVVTPFISDAVKLAAKLNGIAIAFHGNNKSKIDMETILATPVLVITHARYRDLCDSYNTNKAEYRVLIEGRTILIIDEEIRIEKINRVSLTDYLIVKYSIEKLDGRLLQDFNKAFQQVEEILSEIKNGISGLIKFNPAPLTNKEHSIFSRIRGKVEAKSDDYEFFAHLAYIQNLVYIQNEDDYVLAESYSELSETLEKLIKLREASSWFYDRNAIYCVDTNRQYVLLENNILLDASASISSIYKHMSMVDMILAQRLVSHENWTLNICDINTSGSAKRKMYGCFMQDVANLIQSICSNPENKLLVIGSAHDVGSKSEPRGRLQLFYPELCDRFEGRLDFANFASVRGKNKWADYNCCLIIHTPYRPAFCYPLILNANNPALVVLDEDINIRYSKKKGRSYFCHKELDDLRETMVAADIYQAIKRINRSGKQVAQVFLLSADQRMIKTVIKNLPGIQVREFHLPSQKRNEGKRVYNRITENPTMAKLSRLFKEMVAGKHRAYECHDMPGHYTKAWCKAKISYTGMNFTRYLKYLQKDMLEMGIASSQHKIIVLRDVKKTNH